MAENFVGGFLQGLAQSMERRRGRQQRDEEIKTRKKLADAQIELEQIRADKERELIKTHGEEKVREQTLRELLLGQTAPETATVPPSQFSERSAGDEPAGQTLDLPQSIIGQRRESTKQANLKATLVGMVPPSQLAGIAGVETPMDPLVRAAITRAVGGLTPDQGGQPGEIAQGPALPPMDIGITAPPGKQPTVRLNPRREPLGAESRLFKDFEAEQKALGKTPAEIRTAWQEVLKGNAAARGGGTVQGQLGVRSTPQFQQTERDIAQQRAEGAAAGKPLEAAIQKDVTGLEGALRQVDVIEKTLDDNFLGPIKGTEISLAVRRRFGTAIGSPMSNNETQFRTALKDVSDQLLRARSGAQINEKEFARLQSMLPQASDEPIVFRAALLRFKTETAKLIRRKQELGKTPRGALQPGAAPGSSKEDRLRNIFGE